MACCKCCKMPKCVARILGHHVGKVLEERNTWVFMAGLISSGVLGIIILVDLLIGILSLFNCHRNFHHNAGIGTAVLLFIAAIGNLIIFAASRLRQKGAQIAAMVFGGISIGLPALWALISGCYGMYCESNAMMHTIKTGNSTVFAADRCKSAYFDTDVKFCKPYILTAKHELIYFVWYRSVFIGGNLLLFISSIFMVLDFAYILHVALKAKKWNDPGDLDNCLSVGVPNIKSAEDKSKFGKSTEKSKHKQGKFMKLPKGNEANQGVKQFGSPPPYPDISKEGDWVSDRPTPSTKTKTLPVAPPMSNELQTPPDMNDDFRMAGGASDHSLFDAFGQFDSSRSTIRHLASIRTDSGSTVRRLPSGGGTTIQTDRQEVSDVCAVDGSWDDEGSEFEDELWDATYASSGGGGYRTSTPIDDSPTGIKSAYATLSAQSQAYVMQVAAMRQRNGGEMRTASLDGIEQRRIKELPTRASASLDLMRAASHSFDSIATFAWKLQDVENQALEESIAVEVEENPSEYFDGDAEKAMCTSTPSLSTSTY